MCSGVPGADDHIKKSVTAFLKRMGKKTETEHLDLSEEWFLLTGITFTYIYLIILNFGYV